MRATANDGEREQADPEAAARVPQPGQDEEREEDAGEEEGEGEEEVVCLGGWGLSCPLGRGEIEVWLCGC